MPSLREVGVCALLITVGHQVAIASEPVTNSLGMTLVRVEPGEFVMGSGDAPPRSQEEALERDWDEAPAHRVRISQPFLLGAHEVTNAQYEQFDPEHKMLRGKFGNANEDDEPATYVTWRQAVAFCDWLSKREGKPYRLPTEAEWEFACRAGATTPFSTGEQLSAEQANLGLERDGKRKVAAVAVGSYPPNAWGLCDMHGNVAEWCLDWHGPYSAEPQADPVGRADGIARVVRGWSCNRPSYQAAAFFARSANRSGHLPEDANVYTGFRVVQAELPATRPLPPAEPPLHQRDVKQTPARPSRPDSDQPYFIDYSKEGRGPTIPPEAWGPVYAAHNHFAASVVCPNGDVLAMWYTCMGEADRQLAQAASRLRAGAEKWGPASSFFTVPDVNCHAPVLLRDGGRIYHFCTQSLHGWDYAANVMRHSDDSGATWSKPEIILGRDDPDTLSQPCSAFVAQDGTLVLACDGDQGHKDERVMTSGDKGKTWHVRQGDMRKAAGAYAIHPAIVERSDRTMLCWLRGPKPMPLLVSRDFGDTWERRDSPFPGIGVGQKAAALKLASGAILLMSSDTSKELVGGGTFVALSLDDGETWPHVRKVEAPVGGYMSLAQSDDGTVYLIGSRMRFAACNEAWLKEGGPVQSGEEN
ncbi:MAG: SUMF1/EgtB/PvdO family nonheme iron enzyme [Planctomycetales bacterium]